MRGGRQTDGGIFWCSIGYEKLDPRFNQVVGHTPRKEPLVQYNGKKYGTTHVGMDSPLFYCFNTATGAVEDYMLEEYKTNDQMRRMLERTF